MSKKKKPTDINQLAASIVGEATDSLDGKNPAAVALGRLGGLKGGKARAASLSSKRRKEIAKKAAESRWSKGINLKRLAANGELQQIREGSGRIPAIFKKK